MAGNDKVVFPMIPEKNWWDLRNQFKKSVPTNISHTYLKSLLGLTSDQAAKNLLSPLKIMGIIDDSGAPTARANNWRLDDKYSDVCEEIVSEVYPQELLDLFPDKDVDRKKATDWFMARNQLGENAASKVSSVFILLKNATIKDTSTSTPGTNGQAAKTPKMPKKDKPTLVKEVEEKMELNSAHKGGALKPSVHIDLQIHISPDASVEQIDAIFASMAKHLYQ